MPAPAAGSDAQPVRAVGGWLGATASTCCRCAAGAFMRTDDRHDVADSAPARFPAGASRHPGASVCGRRPRGLRGAGRGRGAAAQRFRMEHGLACRARMR
ncbi:hypothetical protein G6F56_014554 [Rhizopus delemar]|nr:hypothetical protein G6F56_014554 [Rhizopus delemar]